MFTRENKLLLLLLIHFDSCCKHAAGNPDISDHFQNIRKFCVSKLLISRPDKINVRVRSVLSEAYQVFVIIISVFISPTDLNFEY